MFINGLSAWSIEISPVSLTSNELCQMLIKLVPFRTYFAVTVSMPGYQTKMTPILLGDNAVNLDFILDPEAGGAHRRMQISDRDCNCSLELAGILRNTYMEVCLAVFVILLFLYILLKRKSMFRLLKQRHSSNHRRVAVV